MNETENRMLNGHGHKPAFSDLLLTELLSTSLTLLSFSEASAFLSSTYDSNKNIISHKYHQQKFKHNNATMQNNCNDN